MFLLRANPASDSFANTWPVHHEHALEERVVLDIAFVKANPCRIRNRDFLHASRRRASHSCGIGDNGFGIQFIFHPPEEMFSSMRILWVVSKNDENKQILITDYS